MGINLVNIGHNLLTSSGTTGILRHLHGPTFVVHSVEPPHYGGPDSFVILLHERANTGSFSRSRDLLHLAKMRWTIIGERGAILVRRNQRLPYGFVVSYVYSVRRCTERSLFDS